MTNANCTQRFPCTCEKLMFQDQASSFSAQIVPAKHYFQPDCFSSLEFDPAKVLFHVRRETILEWTFSRQAVSSHKLFPGMYRFQPHADHPACTIRMQIDKQINVQDELVKAKQNKLQIANYKLKRDARRTGRRAPPRCYGVYTWSEMARLNVKLSALSEVPLSVYS